MAVQILLVLLGCTVLISANSPPIYCSELGAQGPGFPSSASRCTLQGYFKPKQFDASTGYSWCVTPYGKEIVNTRRSPGEAEAVCDAGTDDGSDPDPPGPPGRPGEYEVCPFLMNCRSCWVASANTKMLPGAYMPQCKRNGDFKAKQCHLSTGYCWCAEAKGGAKIAGTEKAPGEGEPNC